MESKAKILLRAVVDCSYLMRSPIGRAQQVRVLLAYARLTIKAVTASRHRPGVERVLGFSVRHFGVGILQFLFREIFVRSEYSFASAQPAPLVFDCGANIGLATLFFKWMYPECEIHAFEPDPETFQVLRDNVTRNGLTNVHLHNVAVAEAEGVLELLAPAGAGGSPLMTIVPSRIGECDTRAVAVTASRLSTFIDARDVDFLKMDVEGAEHRVIRDLSVSGALARVKQIAIEYHHNIGGEDDCLGSFLQALSGGGYRYHLDATWGARSTVNAFQDILIRAARV